MSKIIETDYKKAGFYQFYPKVASVVLVQSQNKLGGLAIAWVSGVSFDPPYVCISLSPRRYSYKLLKEAKEFTVNFLPFTKLEMIAGFGRLSGKDVDKIAVLKPKLDSSKIIKTPVLRDAYSSYECQVEKQVKVGDHILVIGKIVAFHYQKEAFEADTKILKVEKAQPTLYLGADTYIKISSFEKRTITAEDVKAKFISK